MTTYGINNWPPANWRMFDDASVWNAPLDKSNIDPKSATYIHTLMQNGPPEPQTAQKMARWAFPLYWGNASDPLFKITLAESSGPIGREMQGRLVHVPPKVKPSAGTDAAFRLLDQVDGYSYHFRVASVDYDSKVIRAHAGFRLETEGNGFHNIKEPPTGLLPIRPEELAAGVVTHTVGLHVKATSGNPVAPYEFSAAHGQTINGVDPTKCLSFGNIVFLDLSEGDIAGLAVPTWTKAILRGLANHGALVSFNGSNTWTLTYENGYDRTTYGKPDPWKAAGITFPLDFRDALKSIGGWENHLRVVQPFPRPV